MQPEFPRDPAGETAKQGLITVDVGIAYCCVAQVIADRYDPFVTFLVRFGFQVVLDSKV